MSHFSRRSSEEEIAAMHALRELSGDEWAIRVAMVGDRLAKVQVACIVWWDFFSERPAKNRRPQLDSLVAKWDKEKKADVSEVVKAMVQVGYPQRIAIERYGGKV